MEIASISRADSRASVAGRAPLALAARLPSMSDAPQTDRPAAPSAHTPPAGASATATWPSANGDLGYEASAGWIVLRESDDPVAEMFSVSYVAADGGADRPVTFVFNGGPGASSAYLHLGALGPRRVGFAADGTPLPPPARLVDNAESWLAFTDLVFIDPIGTGFSRLIPAAKADKPDPDAEKKAKRFFAFDRDLDSIGEFVRRWLTARGRWGSPVFIAGESYGGYRVARLARLLPEKFGVGLNGVVIISPALEFNLLNAGDYDVPAWVDVLPSMALAAHVNGRGRALPATASLAEVRDAAERFATTDYVTFLVQGAAMARPQRDAVLARLADFLGLPLALVARAEGRVGIATFARELRGADAEVVGLYDASMVSANPFPDRDGMTWPDPTLSGIERVFAAGANQQIRGAIGVQTDREYHLLSLEVNAAWAPDADAKRDWVSGPAGATDDLRYAIALSPHTRYFLCHGLFDLVTPYYASSRLVNLMRLRDDEGARFTHVQFPGGHMFYTWESSRKQFADAVAAFYAASVGTGV